MLTGPLSARTGGGLILRLTRGSKALNLAQSWNSGRRGHVERTMSEEPNLCSAVIEVDPLPLLKNSAFSRIFGLSSSRKLTGETTTQKWRGFKENDCEVYLGIRLISTGMPFGVSFGMMSMAKTNLRMAADTLLMALPQLDHEHTMCMSLTPGDQFLGWKATLFWKTIFLFVSFFVTPPYFEDKISKFRGEKKIKLQTFDIHFCAVL